MCEIIYLSIYLSIVDVQNVGLDWAADGARSEASVSSSALARAGADSGGKDFRDVTHVTGAYLGDNKADR